MKQTRKILVVATKKWRNEKEHIKETKAIMMAGSAFKDVIIDIEYRDLGEPETYLDAQGERRITYDWFETNISNDARARGYHTSRFRFSVAEGKKWGIESNLRGTNYADNPNDFHGEGWIKADANSVARFKDGSKRRLFPKTLAHEEGHELKHAGLTKLEVHDFDYKDNINNIEGFYKQLVILDNSQDVQDNYVTTMLETLNKLKNEILNRAVYPVPRKTFQMNLTQAWLHKNSIYESGYHNGLDIAVPNGQVIVAPQKGTIYLSGLSRQLGNYCFFECTIDGQKTYHLFPHLTSEPKIGSYAKGAELGRVGNTGLSTGPHLHWTILKVKPVSLSHYVSLVNTRERIIKNTIDPYTFALYAVDRIKL
jgi:murein DD-endopeptidase MepM/ murein hydrolase activator NlpD